MVGWPQPKETISVYNFILGTNSTGKSFEEASSTRESMTCTGNMVGDIQPAGYAGEGLTKAGPIVRINSFELHIKDSSFYDNLYNMDPDLWKRKHESGM